MYLNLIQVALLFLAIFIELNSNSNIIIECPISLFSSSYSCTVLAEVRNQSTYRRQLGVPGFWHCIKKSFYLLLFFGTLKLIVIHRRKNLICCPTKNVLRLITELLLYETQESFVSSSRFLSLWLIYCIHTNFEYTSPNPTTLALLTAILLNTLLLRFLFAALLSFIKLLL